MRAFRERYSEAAKQIEALYMDLANALDTYIPGEDEDDEILEQSWGALLSCLSDLANATDDLHERVGRDFPDR